MIMAFGSDRNMKTLSALDPFLTARRRCLAILAAFLLIPVLPSHGSDRDREDRLVEEMEANLFDGDVISLMPGVDTFAAIEMASPILIPRTDRADPLATGPRSLPQPMTILGR